MVSLFNRALDVYSDFALLYQYFSWTTTIVNVPDINDPLVQDRISSNWFGNITYMNITTKTCDLISKSSNVKNKTTGLE